MKDKYGNKLTTKEFFSRWKKGIEGITPIQKLGTQQWGTLISLIGLFCGLIISICAWDKLWWVTIILIGAIINTGVQYLGTTQQLNQLKILERAEAVSVEELFDEYKIKEVEGGNNGY